MTSDELARQVRALSDQAEILDCLTRYARGMDRLDRDLARSAYHGDAVDDHIGFVGPVDDFLDWAFEYHASQSRHQHYITNCSIEVDGDEAHVETYYLFIATERDEDAPLTITGGRYIDHFERRDGRWAIAARLCLVEWQSNAPSLLNGAAVDFVALHGIVARDSSDSSYERPLVLRESAGSESA
jgi:hypothetical protein